jgi:hypothetical protein
MGIGSVSEPVSVRSSPWGGTTRRGLGQRVAVGGLTTKKFVLASFEPAGHVHFLDELWLNFPWWWASVVLASTFAFALGAAFAMLVPR